MTANGKISRLRAMLLAEPDDPLLHAMLGGELLRSGNASGAAEAYERSAELDPSYTAAWKGLGRALVELRRSVEATAALERGIVVATANGDLQAVREMKIWLRRARAGVDE